MEAIIDSGASHPMISQHVARKSGRMYEIVHVNEMFVTASGSRSRPWGLLTHTTSKVGSLAIIIDICLGSTNTYDSFIASYWLNAAEVDISYGNSLLTDELEPERLEIVPVQFLKKGAYRREKKSEGWESSLRSFKDDEFMLSWKAHDQLNLV